MGIPHHLKILMKSMIKSLFAHITTQLNKISNFTSYTSFEGKQLKKQRDFLTYRQTKKPNRLNLMKHTPEMEKKKPHYFYAIL